MRILITRPLEDGEDVARRLVEMGHDTLLSPLLAVRFQSGQPLDLSGIQAVLITSANGARALARRNPDRDVPIFAVGPQSAEAARGAGFLRVRSADGDAMALADMVAKWADPKGGFLLHAAGEDAGPALCERLAAHGFSTRRETLYRMEKAPSLSSEAAQAIREGHAHAAMFLSPRSASLFAECVGRAGLPTNRMIAICISANTADALKDLAFAEIRIAAEPNQAALLAIL